MAAKSPFIGHVNLLHHTSACSVTCFTSCFNAFNICARKQVINKHTRCFCCISVVPVPRSKGISDLCFVVHLVVHWQTNTANEGIVFSQDDAIGRRFVLLIILEDGSDKCPGIFNIFVLRKRRPERHALIFAVAMDRLVISYRKPTDLKPFGFEGERCTMKFFVCHKMGHTSPKTRYKLVKIQYSNHVKLKSILIILFSLVLFAGGADAQRKKTP